MLDIKIIFKIYLKILKIVILSFQIDFCSIKIIEQFSKIVLENYLLELFFKIVTKHAIGI